MADGENMSVEVLEKNKSVPLEERERLLEEKIRANAEKKRSLQWLINEEFEEAKRLQVSLEKTRPIRGYVAVVSRHWLE